MGIFNSAGKKKRIINNVNELRSKFLGLKEGFKSETVVISTSGSKVSQAENTINVIGNVCNDIINALDTGDASDGPISNSQLADGMLHLVSDAKRDTLIVKMAFGDEAMNLYSQYVTELESIANIISKLK